MAPTKTLPRHLKLKRKHKIKKKKRREEVNVECKASKHPLEPTLVPWISKFEWQTVKQKIFSSAIQDKIFALNRLSTWKSRCYGKIPLGIEVTDTLLRAYVRDFMSQNSDEAQILQGDLIMMYSAAIIRFVNLVTEVGQKGGRKTPVDLISQKFHIPEWLVDLRHEASHTNFPPLSVLQAAFHLAMNWIEQNYWDKEASRMSELCAKDPTEIFNAENKSNSKISAAKNNFKSWELATEEIEWKDYPLGILPSQIVELPFLDLSLPVSVDSLYCHQAAVRSGCNVDTIDTETVEEEQNYSTLEMPNLEERLHITKFTKRAHFWTEAQLKAIQSALVIF